MKKPLLSDVARKFFVHERNNEQQGGDSPSTLSSALDTLRQMSDVMFQNIYEAKKTDLENEIYALAKQYGFDRELAELLTNDKELLSKKTLIQIIDALILSADNTGCSDDLIVVGHDELENLRKWRNGSRYHK